MKEMEKQRGDGKVSEFILKIPIKIKTQLKSVLKEFPNGISFKRLSGEFLSRYNYILNIYFTGHTQNEAVLQVGQNEDRNCFEDNPTFNFGESSSENKTEDELESRFEFLELKGLINKINFAKEISKQSFTSLGSSRSSSLSSISSDSYLEFKFEQMMSESSSSDYSSLGLDCEQSKSSDIVVNFFDRWVWKANEVYKVHLGNVYDPSKFWITFIDVGHFQKYLWDFYEKHKQDYVIPLEEICIGLNCVANITNLYYRGRIIRVDIQTNYKFRIYLYDFGMICSVHLNDLFQLDNQFFEVAAFAVRASLANISSIDDHMWKQNAVNRFLELTADKPLAAEIVRVHANRKILEINLADTSSSIKGCIEIINRILVTENLAKYSCNPPISSNSSTLYKPKVKYLYLYPSFELIENGIVPAEVGLSESLKKIVAWDILYPQYYVYTP